MKNNIKHNDKPSGLSKLPDSIIIKGARVNNLKNIDVEIPHNKIVVVTGLSGSGKTSLVFDTIYAEGQRRYIESLSSYARQFLERINKPDVDIITGLAPSMAIEVKQGTRNPRSTVGTSTEIYDYLRLLFARSGKTFSPVSGKEVKKDDIEDIFKFIREQKDGSKIYIVFPLLLHSSKSVKDEIDNLKQKGFFRIIAGNDLIDLNTFGDFKKLNTVDIKVITDRFAYKKDDDDLAQRIRESLEQAYVEGEGYLSVLIASPELNQDAEISKMNKKNAVMTQGIASLPPAIKSYNYNLHLELDGIRFEQPEPVLFSFNNPIGACPRCQGFGETIDLDPDLVIPDKSKTLFKNAIHPFSTPKHSRHLSDLIAASKNNNIRLHVPYKDLTKDELDKVWNGSGEYIGIKKFFRMVEREAAYKIHYRVLLSRYRAYTKCAECDGSRLKKEALYVKFQEKTINDLVKSNIEDLYHFFNGIKLNDYDKKVAGRILEEIRNRLSYLYEVGLGYLTLNRLTSTLSGGETQRINLATSLGSSLVGSIYVLDEPSIGLHPRDNDRLIKILKSLRDIGNSVIVVEHDPEMINSSDYIIDMGPRAGEYGGEVVFAGNLKEIKKSQNSLTGKYLSKKLNIDIPASRRKPNTHSVKLKGASENNLKNIDVEFPLGIFTCITGVSGSGKSTLINDILYGALKKRIYGIYNDKIGAFSDITGYNYINAVELVDQTPIGRSPRSNPVTYLKIFDQIRDIY
ncbi:MAG: excinuclease ABC subunit UvrA, partial [Ignavibacteria bacterium]